MDRLMVFGFISGFVATVLLGYRRHLKTRLPIIPAALTACTVYAFLQGAWPVGFCLIAITATELATWKNRLTINGAQPLSAVRHIQLPVAESRITRMFGSIG